jgi:hypothetical protein
MANVAKLVTSNSFVIEKGIPTPHKKGRTPDFPLDQMEVGDSFAFAGELVSRVRSSAAYQQRRFPMRAFSVRAEGDHYRCWRIA